MAESTELGRTQIITKDGIVTATVFDTVSPDRVVLSLIRGSNAAIYGRVTDTTPLISKSIKDILIFPFSEL